MQFTPRVTAGDNGLFTTKSRPSNKAPDPGGAPP
jgi:hypothetical protein